MKLSVSAYRAQASAHKKILCSYQHQLSYGATTSRTRTPSDPAAAFFSALKVDRAENEEAQGSLAHFSGHRNVAFRSRMGPGLDSGDSAPSSVPHSLATSREEEDDDDDESSGRRSDGRGGSRTKSNQRWMKLRTTVQISSAIQKKPPLKREDSFLKRFSTRHLPESQETLDTAEAEASGGDRSSQSRRRRRTKLQKPPFTVVNPDENFYFYWLMVLSFCVLYNLWTLIVRQSLPELQQLAPTVWFGCDSFTDVIFFLDVAVQFRTGYLEQGLMVYNSKKLAGHYLKSKSFVMDLLALMPLDLLQVNLGTNPMLRFPRFLKIYRVYNYYYMVESRTVYPNLWRVLNLIHILLILAHWFGCFYYLLSEVEGFQGDWVYPYRPGEYSTLTRKYLGSLYWSTLTLTTIGDLPTPETNAEILANGNPRSLARRGRLSRLLQFKHNGGYVFTIVSYLIGVFIFATIVGQVGNVITNRNANRLEFERLLDGAKTYMRHHKVPGGMKRRVLRWYDYSWSRGRIQGGGDINTALGLLPDKLKTDLALHVNLSVLKKVTIFQECQPEFLHDLVLKMKAYIFTPGDSICRKGEVAREMFIIADGILEVISETGRVLTTMKAGDFFGEIGILNLDGLNKRTADVRSVGYSELFSLSREDVLAAMKDYPDAQEILQSLGRKRLMEAQRVARSAKQSASSPGHDSSDNSAGKRIVDKLRSDVKGLKNALRKSRRSTRNEEGVELQPLTMRGAMLRRQPKIDEGADATTSLEPPVSPLGAGLPLLSRLRLLKEKQEREEKRNLMETVRQYPEAPQENQSLLQRILSMKARADQESLNEKESIAKEPLLPKDAIPEETETSSPREFAEDDSRPETEEGNGTIKKPWAMLKDASLKKDGAPSSPSSRKTTALKQNLMQLRQQTKMYASVDDLSPEYCGLPFVKKLKILNERQKLAELEKAVRSASLDCGESLSMEFDMSLTRSHSEASAIEYARRLAKLNQEKSKLEGDKLSPENETLERRNLKSILKNMSISRTGSSDVSISSTAEQVTKVELRKLMRAPTIEGYAARHTKLSKSVTFNKYTLQSPPPEDAPSLSSGVRKIEDSQEQFALPPPNNHSFRPSGSGNVLQVPQVIEDDCMGELVKGIREIVYDRWEDIQHKVEHHFTSMEYEIRKRDEIITQLQARIQTLEGNEDPLEDSGDSTEAEGSIEEDCVEHDYPFARDGSVDTVLSARPRLRRSPPSTDSSNNRRSWEEHSEEETLELQDLPCSITPQPLWNEDVAIELESNSSRSDEEEGAVGNGRTNDWEVMMLAEQLESRQRSQEHSGPGS